MNNNKLFTLLFGLVSIFGISALAVGFAQKNEGYQPKSISAKQALQQKAVRDYSAEVDEPSGSLSIAATSSTLTSMGQSFSLSFSTGGQGFCDTTSSYLLAPKDDSFDAYYAEFSKMSADEREAIIEQYNAGEYETVHFNSYVFNITGSSDTKNVVIPRYLTRNHIFTLDITEIGTDAATAADWGNITSITIPVEVANIYSDSFVDVPSTMIFNVEAASRPEGWAEDWAHGAVVNYGYSFPADKEEMSSRAGAQDYGDKTVNFILGWYPSEGQQYPLVAEYKIKKADGSLSETQYFDFSPSSENSKYEAVGYEIVAFKNSLNCDIPLEPGEEIDGDSIVLHNIFSAVKGSSGSFEPDTAHPYRYVPKQMYSRVYKIDDFIKYEFTGISSFSGYTGIDLDMRVSEENIYSYLKSNYYNSHKDEIDAGTLYVRYRLTSLTLSSFRITYRHGGADVVKDVKIATPVTQFKMNNNGVNKVSFLLKNSDVGVGFTASSVKEVSLVGLYVSLDLMGAKATIARSSVVTRFGYVSFMPYTESPQVFDINLMLILVLVGYVAAYALSTVGLYFYLKNKYKNDEFRRMKTKPYIIKSLIGLGGSLVVIYALLFIILRAVAMNNAIVVFNPLDAYIIILSVLSVVIIGYFIKYLVGVVKVMKERRRILKLKLNEDVEDDGTN